VTIDPAEDARWAAAANMSTTLGDIGLFPRWLKPVVWIGLALIVVVLFAAGSILVFVLPDDGTDVSRFNLWTGLNTVGAVITFGGLAWAVKTNRFYSQWNSVSSPLNARDLKSARRQMAGTQEEVPERVPVLRAMAEQERRNTPAGLLVFTGAIVLAVAQLLVAENTFQLVTDSVIAFLIVVMVVREIIVFRRNGRFLATHQRG
jgi:hypothetical protein